MKIALTYPFFCLVVLAWLVRAEMRGEVWGTIFGVGGKRYYSAYNHK